MVGITPIGYFVGCPHCERELRIDGKYIGTQVQCKFCSGAFTYELSKCPHCKRGLRIDGKYIGTQVQCKFCSGAFNYDLSNRLINARAFYAECGHCSHELRIDKKYSGVIVACKFCSGKVLCSGKVHLFCSGKVHLQQRQNPTIFRIERDGSTLVVIPQGDALRFRYVDVHLEANALERESSAPDIRLLLIDLRDVTVIGSIMLDALVKLARNATNGGRHAAFCNASKEMQEILETTKLATVWPLYDSRVSAMTALLDDHDQLSEPLDIQSQHYDVSGLLREDRLRILAVAFRPTTEKERLLFPD